MPVTLTSSSLIKPWGEILFFSNSIMYTRKAFRLLLFYLSDKLLSKTYYYKLQKLYNVHIYK